MIFKFHIGQRVTHYDTPAVVLEIEPRLHGAHYYFIATADGRLWCLESELEGEE